MKKTLSKPWFFSVLIVVLMPMLFACGTTFETVVDYAYKPFSETLVEPDGKMGISLVGTPDVREDGTVRLYARFHPPSNAEGDVSLQDVDVELGWVGTEAHKLPMLLPDFQWRSTSDPSVPHIRHLKVRPGKVEDVDWALWPKSVAMVSGFPTDGSFNKIWFDLYTQQGEILLDEQHLATLWGWEWVPATDTDTAYVRLWAGGTLEEPQFERVYMAKAKAKEAVNTSPE